MRGRRKAADCSAGAESVEIEINAGYERSPRRTRRNRHAHRVAPRNDVSPPCQLRIAARQGLASRHLLQSNSPRSKHEQRAVVTSVVERGREFTHELVLLRIVADATLLDRLRRVDRHPMRQTATLESEPSRYSPRYVLTQSLEDRHRLRAPLVIRSRGRYQHPHFGQTEVAEEVARHEVR